MITSKTDLVDFLEGGGGFSKNLASSVYCILSLHLPRIAADLIILNRGGSRIFSRGGGGFENLSTFFLVRPN